MLGFEYRPTIWIGIYNRLRLLDFSDLPEGAAVGKGNVKGKSSMDHIMEEKLVEETDDFKIYSM